MMSLSHTTGYAIQALACLESAEGRPCLVRDVAECTKLPRAYLARIINRLAHHGLVTARRGYRGGIQLARPPRDISLLQVVEAVEGKEWIGPCLLGIKECGSDLVCPTRPFWLEMRRRIERKLRQTTLASFTGAKGFREPRRRPSGLGDDSSARFGAFAVKGEQPTVRGRPGWPDRVRSEKRARVFKNDNGYNSIS